MADVGKELKTDFPGVAVLYRSGGVLDAAILAFRRNLTSACVRDMPNDKRPIEPTISRAFIARPRQSTKRVSSERHRPKQACGYRE